MWVYCWSTACDIGPTIKQNWPSVSSLLKITLYSKSVFFPYFQDALAAIGHRDVLTKLDLELNPPEPVVEVQEEPPAFLEKYLIPYYREVEKYDALKAANKSYGLCEGYDFWHAAS